MTGSPRTRDRDAVSIALDALRTMIVTGDIPPGTELSQVKLAENIGVSTTPLREALSRLEAEGLVESRRNRRPRVPPFDPMELDAVYCHRVLLESLAVSLSVPAMTEDDLKGLRADLDAMRAPTKDPAAWDAAHASFHLGLVARVAPPLREQISGFMARSARYRRMSVLGDDPAGRSAGDKEHEAILEACTARDAGEAALLLARHLTRSALTLMAHLAPDTDPQSVRSALQMVMDGAG
jgi:DNA-binding GntR family transcriptional regulator